jgi:predicted permease
MMREIQYAFRQLLKNPGFSAAALLSLAIGIGANATVLCWIQNIVWRPLPGVASQEQIVVLVSNQGGGGASLMDLRDFSQLDSVFAGAVASQITPASVLIDNQRHWLYGQIATANFFDLLGVKPILGRTFRPDEDLRPGGDAVLVLSESCWRTRFNADRAIIGKSIDLNRHAFTVIGVVPSEFLGTMTGLACDFWAPVSMIYEVTKRQDNSLVSRSSRGFHNLARLQPGVTVERAQAAVDALDADLAAAFPNTNREVRHLVLPYSKCPYGVQSILGPTLYLLLAVSLGVLLIVAANIANLLLARASSRRKEIAIRLATGASRRRLIRQLLTESLVLAMLGGIGGVLVATWAVDLVAAFVPPLQLPVSMRYQLDAATLGLTLALTLCIGAVFGLAPAVQASQPNLHETLKEGGRCSSGGAGQHRLRNGLVVCEVALALVLLVGAGLCLQGLDRARQIDLGLDPDRVLIGGLQLGMNGYTEETGKVFYRQLERRLADLPEIEEAALASWFPLGLAGCKGHGVSVPGYVRPHGENPTYEYSLISPRYFAALRVPLVAGREFSDADDAHSARVAIVNEHFARRFWPNQDPLNRQFRASGKDWTVVGVAKAGKYNSLREEPWPFFFLPYQQHVPDLDLSICVRTRIDPEAFAHTLRQVVRELDPEVELWGTMPMRDHIQGALFAQRIATNLLGWLGVVALLLAAMGVYAVVAYTVSQRTQEFGVRIALGATSSQVLLLVVRQVMALTALGVAIGLALALPTTHLLSNFLYGVSPLDPLTFAGVALTLTVVTLLACLLPALRATRVDPMAALRLE